MGEPSDFTYFNGSLYVALLGKLLKSNVTPKVGNTSEGYLKLEPFLENHDDVLKIMAFDPSLQRGKME